MKKLGAQRLKDVDGMFVKISQRETARGVTDVSEIVFVSVHGILYSIQPPAVLSK